MKKNRSSAGGATALAKTACTAVGMLAPAVALAHPVDSPSVDFAAGILHPLTGLDHVLAMTLVGLWAVQRAGHARWAGPALFVAVVVVAGLGASVFPPHAIDQLAAISVAALGLLVVAPRRVPLWVAAVLLAAFATIHGQAHGIAATMHSAPLAFSAGFAVSTLALSCAGMLGAVVAQRCDRASLLRMAGASAAVAGMVLTTLLAVR